MRGRFKDVFSSPAGTARAEDPAGQGTLQSDTSHAEKVLSFFKEAHFASEEAKAVPGGVVRHGDPKGTDVALMLAE